MTSETTQSKTTINPVIIGGVIGTSVGILASANTGKKVVGGIGKSAFVQKAGEELCDLAREMIYDQTKFMLKQSLSNSLANYQQKIFPALETRDDETNDEAKTHKQAQTKSNDPYKELKQENQELKENLSRIEDKLNQLLGAMES
ncbi:GvpT/GvpP family gas vesicle accessory protein [Lentibacillus sp. JNUCC-1]|uniref:GvpT/GvpP family gas vesicle accessory protein n=1 Tax=Lentibacillus sp. JNUCC-1 TaxID=2654513 RepID=UPI0012E92295|nr:GvpT/GvpP family gas vesicle accessory protein [Lentibacillus sp. JNUCC-1]